MKLNRYKLFIVGLVYMFIMHSCITPGLLDLFDEPEEIADGYYYEPFFNGIAYDVSGSSLTNFDFTSVITGIDGYKNLDDHILIRQKINKPESDKKVMVGFRYKEKAPWLKFNQSFFEEEVTDATRFYTHGLNNVYYFILHKPTRELSGPFIYEEFIDTCNHLNIRIF